MSTHLASSVLMVRPSHFSHNAQTATTNLFQVNEPIGDPEYIEQKAQEEFDGYAAVLKEKGINVLIAYDTPEPQKPDACFPNNWVTFHHDGTIVLYPMYSPNRRYERRRGILELIRQEFEVEQEIDFTHYEAEEKFLEGTGSMVFDHEERICYASLSARTHDDVVHDFCEKRNYRLVRFETKDPNGNPIYHTNVLFSLGKHYAVICLDSIRLEQEKEMLIDNLQSTNREIIDITYDQMFQFCGNVLELKNQEGKSILAMSERAYLSFLPEQMELIKHYSEVAYAPLNTIERISGGGARCMLAEIFLPKKQKH